MSDEQKCCKSCFVERDILQCKECIAIKCRCLFGSNHVCVECLTRNEKILRIINELSQSIE